MLFDVITLVLVLYSCVSPFLYLKALKIGIRLAEDPVKESEEPIVKLPKPKRKVKPDPRTQRLMEIYTNVDNYDGTANGQKKIGD